MKATTRRLLHIPTVVALVAMLLPQALAATTGTGLLFDDENELGKPDRPGERVTGEMVGRRLDSQHADRAR